MMMQKLWLALFVLLPRVTVTAVCISWDGRDRCWLEGEPDSADGATQGSIPLLVDLHGLTSSNTQLQYYGLGSIYNSKGFFVAWPQGVGVVGSTSSWNAGRYCCGAASSENVDDEGFLLKMIETMIATNPAIDSRRVYISGHSNGCIMSNVMAIKHSDVIAGMGCFSGHSAGNQFDTSGYKPMPSIIAQGTADDTIPYATVSAWVKGGLKDANDCGDTPTTTSFGDNKVETFSCADGNEVALLTLDGVGHSPYTNLDSGTPSTNYVWDFISRGSLDHTPSDVPSGGSNEGPSDAPSGGGSNEGGVNNEGSSAAVAQVSLLISSTLVMRLLAY